VCLIRPSVDININAVTGVHVATACVNVKASPSRPVRCKHECLCSDGSHKVFGFSLQWTGVENMVYGIGQRVFVIKIGRNVNSKK
jgi:hypothetical protein